MAFGNFGDVATGLSSAGTTQATATECPADHCLFSTVAAGEGARMKAGNARDFRTITNQSATAPLKWYPPVGASLNGMTENLPLVIPPNTAAQALFFSATAVSAFF